MRYMGGESKGIFQWFGAEFHYLIPDLSQLLFQIHSIKQDFFVHFLSKIFHGKEIVLPESDTDLVLLYLMMIYNLCSYLLLSTYLLITFLN